MYVVDFHDSKLKAMLPLASQCKTLLMFDHLVQFNEKITFFFCINLVFVDSGDDSETEMNEWENQQIRKGVTGAQVDLLLSLTIVICILN